MRNVRMRNIWLVDGLSLKWKMPLTCSDQKDFPSQRQLHFPALFPLFRFAAYF